MPALDQKLYQLIISRLDGENISSPSYAEKAVELVQKGIGGFILFGGRKNEVKAFIERLQSLADIPLFIASDIERGVGQQVDGATHFPGQMALAAATDRKNKSNVQVLEQAIQAIADESADIGLNMPLIPVLDVNTNPDNPIICTRAFSDDPDVVSLYGQMYIRTLEKKGLISCAKHFPGHGDTAVDSHISLPVISKSLRELHDTDLPPFIEAIKADVSSIMLGHISVPAIDDLPASLSKKLIGDLLRKELGFNGLVLTDALNMQALNELGDVPVKCINAGVDILLHPADASGVVKELRQAIASGEIKEETIDAAVKRISTYKSQIGSINKSEADYKKHAVLSSEISERAITLIKDKPDLLPLKNLCDISLVYTYDENRHDISEIKTFIIENSPIHVGAGLKPAPTIIIALFTSIAAWAGTSGISAEDINAIRALIKKSRDSIVISFGSPYVLRHFDEADMLVAAYDSSPQAQSSVIKCLKGEKEFVGKLPVSI